MPTRARLFLGASLPLVVLACTSAAVREGDAGKSSELLQGVVDEYLRDTPNILGATVRVDIQGTGSWEAARGFIDTTRTIRPLEIEAEHLYALARSDDGGTWLVKYGIHRP